ncbi:PET123 [Candida oxycetoniae]|uniref:PET123 n=1 Tax=Candida oxycetoniae TaxID=497107 RepID=A0AAI9T2L2_9ASCO|nr:PET123 [Candida oxycetoniae]KAI3407110.1 PET123 [Candida oxycetoniae]
MGKGVLKYGGKSGILPKKINIFTRPIRPMNEWEKQRKEEAKESGYAPGVPTPIINKVQLPRQHPPRKVITVQERIAAIKYPPMSLQEMNSLPEAERDAQKRAYYRAEFLKEAYLEEEKRLEKIDQMKKKIHEQDLERQQKEESDHKASVISSLPTIQKILEDGLVRQRTQDEKALLKEERKLNMRSKELHEKEEKFQKLLELYQASGKFITSEEQLEEAIYRAFEVDVDKFETSQTIVDSKLFSDNASYLVGEANEQKIADAVLGEINGKPGLEQVKDVLSGAREKVKREAHINLRSSMNPTN